MTLKQSPRYADGEPLAPFRRIIDHYPVGARARSILCGHLVQGEDGKDYGRTSYRITALHLANIGWLATCTEEGNLTRYTLSGRGEEIRKELRNA